MLKAHFLNVGHGDCAFIELPSGRLMMVDINNSLSLPEDDVEALAALHNLTAYDFRRQGSYSSVLAKSWEDYYKSLLVDPVDYYKNNFSGKPVFRYIQTHPDMDHMTGLYRFFWQEQIPLWNFWDIAHSKEKEESDFEQSKHDYLDWLVYQVLRDGKGPNNASHVTIKNKRFNTGDFWSSDSIKVLSPNDDLLIGANEKENWNDASYVLGLTHGGRTLILGGDAGQEAWKNMVDEIDAAHLSCDVLKASHHGRDSGYHEEAVGIMNPKAVICSVGKKPDTDAHDKYRKQGADVFSTRSKGTIIVTIWEDGEVWINDAQGNELKKMAPLI